MQASVTQASRQPKPKMLTVPLLWGLVDGADPDKLVTDGYDYFVGARFTEYERGFLMARQALKRRERTN